MIKVEQLYEADSYKGCSVNNIHGCVTLMFTVLTQMSKRTMNNGQTLCSSM